MARAPSSALGRVHSGLNTLRLDHDGQLRLGACWSGIRGGDVRLAGGGAVPG